MSVYEVFTASLLEPCDPSEGYRLLGLELKFPDDLCRDEGSALRRKAFLLEDRAALAHGSYGAASTVAVAAGEHIRALIERNPNGFFYRTLYPCLSWATRVVAAFVNAAPSHVALVPNVEFGIAAALNGVLQSGMETLCQPGSRVLVTSLTYGAVRSAVREAARARNCTVEEVQLPLGGDLDEDEVVARFRAALEGGDAPVGLAVFEHIASPTAVVLPVARLCEMCRKLGVVTVIDGAHALGAVPLDLEAIGADVYTSNGHKWLMNQRGSAIMCVSERMRKVVHPAVSSWGLGAGFNAEFVWQGTMDYTPHLTLPVAIEFLRWCGHGDAEHVMRRNKTLAAQVGRILADILGTDTIVPPNMAACMVCVRLPEYSPSPAEVRSGLASGSDPIELPVFHTDGSSYIRISIAVYTDLNDVLTMCTKLLACIGAPVEAAQRLERHR